ncbi:LacI family DNA-binding transcriptional regulator [Weissella kandleri]|uniref:LacI family DNA-binding transcriptional regulator n=1 Tax=Weissella kandleri TaxID=1616 RepID=UPI00387E37F8
MKKKLTINDIAAQANVSKTTVSRFLNHKYDNMSEATKNKIAQTIEASGYQPNRQAQTLKTASTHTIGVSVADLSNLYTSRLLKGISTFLHQTQYQMIIMDADNNLQREQNNLQVLLNENIDGLIIQPLAHHPDTYQIIQDNSLPTIQVDRYVEPFTWPAVVSDNFQKSVEVAKLLEKNNFKHIIIISNNITGISSRMNRVQGITSHLQANDISYELLEIDGSNDWQIQLQSKIKQSYKKVAIYALNSQVLWPIMRVLNTSNLKVPQDVGVIGFNDDDLADLVAPGITAIEQNPILIGETAVQQLIDNLKQHESNTDITRIEAKIEIRNSL